MKINHNMSAYIANSHLLRNEGKLTTSLEKLSSGYRINRASDDVAGMAISSKMRSQIAGLNQASRNASDGISVIGTAEGALTEVTSMIQRMRELSVQAANGTYESDDIEAIQKEIDKLTEEVDRISTDTEFNKKAILNGSLGRRTYADTRDVSFIEVSDTVKPGDYGFEITEDARQAAVEGGAGNPNVYEDPENPGNFIAPEGKVTINGVEIKIEEGDTPAIIYEKLRTGAERAEVNIIPVDTIPVIDDAALIANPDTGGYEAFAGGYVPGNPLVLVSEDYGSKAAVSVQCDNPLLAEYLGFGTVAEVDYGTNVEGVVTGAGYTAQATFTGDGKTVTVSDRGGFSISFDVAAASVATAREDNVDMDVTLSVMDIGTMTLQIGANEFQTLSVDIPDMSAKALRIRDIDVTTINGPDKAMAALDEALAKVSGVRSKLGANENRLNHAVASLGGTEENMTAALSRIEDVDMAEEMSTYTQMNVLTQAATSVLAQANDIPQQVLQLLQ